MKSKFLFCMLFAICWTTVLAQRDDAIVVERPSDRKNLLQIGPKIGATLTTMSQPHETRLYDGSDIGFSVGVAYRIRFGNATENSDAGTGFWGMGLEVKFKQNSVKTIAEDESGKQNAKLSMNYLEIPVLFQIYPFYKSKTLNSLYLEIGPDMAWVLSSSPKSLTVCNPNSQFAAVEYNINNNGSKLKGTDFRGIIGLGYTIPNTKLDINARYYWSNGSLAENFPCKMNSAELSVSWMFDGWMF